MAAGPALDPAVAILLLPGYGVTTPAPPRRASLAGGEVVEGSWTRPYPAVAGLH